MLEFNIQTKMTGEEYEFIISLAKKQNRTVSNLVRLWLLEKMREEYGFK